MSVERNIGEHIRHHLLELNRKSTTEERIKGLRERRKARRRGKLKEPQVNEVTGEDFNSDKVFLEEGLGQDLSDVLYNLGLGSLAAGEGNQVKGVEEKMLSRTERFLEHLARSRQRQAGSTVSPNKRERERVLGSDDWENGARVLEALSYEELFGQAKEYLTKQGILLEQINVRLLVIKQGSNSKDPLFHAGIPSLPVLLIGQEEFPEDLKIKAKGGQPDGRFRIILREEAKKKIFTLSSCKIMKSPIGFSSDFSAMKIPHQEWILIGPVSVNERGLLGFGCLAFIFSKPGRRPICCRMVLKYPRGL